MTSAWTVSLTAPLSFRICLCSHETVLEGSDQIWSPRHVKWTFVPLSEPIQEASHDNCLSSLTKIMEDVWEKKMLRPGLWLGTIPRVFMRNFHPVLQISHFLHQLDVLVNLPSMTVFLPSVSDNEAAEQIWKNEVPHSRFVLFALVLDGSSSISSPARLSKVPLNSILT